MDYDAFDRRTSRWKRGSRWGRTLAAAIAIASLTTPAVAAPPESGGQSDAPKSKKDKWIYKWAPVNMMGEIGIYGGIVLPSTRLELFEPDRTLPDQGYQGLNRVAADIGIRGGFYPLRFVGVEGEIGVMPARVANDGPRATLWTVRGHVVGQLGLWSITPFVLLGVGAFGVGSDRAALGNDVDTALHFGGGVKFFINRWIALRLDLRDIVSNQRGVGEGLTHTGEVLLGVSLTLRPKKKDDPVADEGPKDSDGDGFLDDEDLCVDVPGVAPDGCPLSDKDGDGFVDAEDKCPDEPGIEPDGCPRPDKDGDKIADAEDKCPEQPESKNGFEDMDGCPDEVPQDVGEFNGVIAGVEFEVNSAQIRPSSRKKLDKAVDILNKYPNLKLEIGGHTDSTGSRDYNLDLSRRRAKSVQKYLTSKGIDEARLDTRGYGPDQPIDTNDTDEGRSKNRRIEFTIKSK